MAGLSKRLKQLEKELLLLGEEAMLLEEVDGFIAGLLVCPDLIRPGEWLPLVWGQDDPDSGAAFTNLDDVKRLLGPLMGHYNQVARTLFEQPNRYKPLLTRDKGSGEILWESWVLGFKQAMDLRARAWQRLADADLQASGALKGLRRLIDIAFGDRRISQDERDYVTTSAPKDIARWIVALNRWRFEAAQGILSIIDISPRPTRPSGHHWHAKTRRA